MELDMSAEYPFFILRNCYIEPINCVVIRMNERRQSHCCTEVYVCALVVTFSSSE